MAMSLDTPTTDSRKNGWNNVPGTYGHTHCHRVEPSGLCQPKNSRSTVKLERGVRIPLLLNSHGNILRLSKLLSPSNTEDFFSSFGNSTEEDGVPP